MDVGWSSDSDRMILKASPDSHARPKRQQKTQKATHNTCTQQYNTLQRLQHTMQRLIKSNKYTHKLLATFAVFHSASVPFGIILERFARSATLPTLPTVSTVPTGPNVPTVPTVSTGPTLPTGPTGPTVPTGQYNCAREVAPL